MLIVYACVYANLAIGGIVDRGVMIGAGAVILLVVFLLAKPLTEVIGASS